METLYTRTDRFFVPGPVAQSPWNATHQSGIALAGLLASLVEEAPSEQPMLITRLSGAAQADGTGNPPKEVQHDQR